jgi:5-methyltetrahydrofolate--homocysteine methyltransferase
MVGYCFGYGAPLHYSEQTVWQDPIIDDWDNRPSLDLDDDEYSWRQVQAVVKRCSEVSAGKWMTGFPNIHQPNDHVSLLRGTQRFLMDLIERPEDVKRAMRKLLDNWYVVYERLADMSPQQEGSSGWLGLWSPWRRSVTMQSDVSCMMSPAMFEEFVVPELEEVSEWLEGCTYHLDGPGAFQHLDRILALKRLHAVQWSPGSGAPQGMYWLDLYKRIQAGGKGVVIYLPYEEVETAVRELKPEKTFIITGAPSVDAAEALLERAVEITKGR